MNEDAQPRPAIVAPVVRYLGVSDGARSAAFYRGVLGFEIRQGPEGIEAVSGPAVLHLGTHGFAPDDWAHPRPPGSAILFFETDDVAGMHAAVLARGGKPSEMEKVNRIKMRMFELRDPDGHTLWFGESYDRPDRPPDGHMLQQILPELPLADVPAGIAHYRDVLGFRVNHQQHDLGVMYRDRVTLLLIARTERHKGIGSTYVYVENADRLCAELRARGAQVQGDPISHPWGLRDFEVLDPEGNRLRFGQPFE